ncbi:MAG: PAS domain S-box protein, partial [Proteobacteria bacterium]|nr:PAS domain S-box protein [Pseudomonadota bacterium]
MTKKQLLEELTRLRRRVSELETSEAELRRTEEAASPAKVRLEHLISIAPTVMYTCRASGDFGVTFISPDVKAKLGYDPEEFLADSGFWAEHIHPDDAARVLAELPSILEKGRQVHEYRFQHQDGSYRWMHDEVVLVRDEAGTPLEMVGSWTDITHLKRVERELLPLKNIIESASSVTATADLDGKMNYVNPAFLRIWGFDDTSEIYGRPYWDFWMFEDRLEELTATLNNEGMWSGEIKARKRDGALFDVQVSAAVVRDEAGRPVALMSSSVDVTERKQAEDRFRLAARVASDLIYEWDLNDDTLLWFGDIDGALGFDPGEFPRTIEAWVGRIHPDDMARLAGAVEHHRQSTEPIAYDYRIQRKDGSWRYWTDHAAPLLDQTGRPHKWIGVCTDITQRKRAEVALRDSEEKFRELVERAQDGIVIIHQQLVEYVNPAYARLTGYESEELVGQPFTILLDHQEIDKVVDRYHRRMAGEDVPAIYETRLVRKDGRVIDVEFNAGVFNYQGQPANLTIVRDIGERKRAEAALRESEEKFRTLTESSPVGMFLDDTQGNAVFINERCAKLIGMPSDEALNFDWMLAIHPDDRERVTGQWAKAVKHGEPFHEEYRWVHADGRVVWTLGEIAPVRNPEGEVTLFIGTLTDITERKRAETALQESEARFRDLAELLPESIFEMDSAGRLTFANRTAFDQFGYTPQDLERGLDAYEMLVPQERPQAREMSQRILAGEDIGLSEYSALTKDGRVFPALFRSTAIFRDGRPVGLRGFIIDITERKRAEDSLRESEERYRTVLENTGTAVSVTAEDGVLAMVNGRFEELSGFPRDEIEGHKGWTAFVAPKDLPRLRDYRERRLRGEPAPSQFEFVFVDRLGNRRHVVNTETLIPGTSRTVSSLVDITERKQAEAALQESQEKYLSILESSPDPVVQYDQAGRVIYVNQAFTRVFGWTLEELVGRSIDFVPEEDWPDTQRAIERMKRGESFYGFETHRLTKDGRLLDVMVNVAVWRDRNGVPAGSVVTLQDVTERKRMEAQFQHARKMEAVGTLAGGVAHDFNNALQAISGYVQLLLLKKEADDPDHEYLFAIDQAIQRAGGLINQLLTVSRKMESKPEPVDLGQVVVEACKLLERTIPRMIRIEVDNAGDLGPVNADPSQLEQIILNLGGNARDAMPDGGQLTFTTRNLTITDGP